jgi:hypothetical protein
MAEPSVPDRTSSEGGRQGQPVTKSAALGGWKETVMRYVRTFVLVLLLALGAATGARAFGPSVVPSGVASR